MRDDGYDNSDYVSINPAYGTVQQFKTLLHEAHLRGIRVITELVLNHTSDQHPWFLRAKHAEPGSPWRDFYVWSDTPDRYRDARVIFKDFERSNWSWDPEVGAYYWHRFYSHQPDLNYDNPAVQKAVLDVVDFWFKLGVDGLRVDAVPYLFQCEATSCENLPETHWFLNRLRRHIEGKFKNRMLLAEANQLPEDRALEGAELVGAGDSSRLLRRRDRHGGEHLPGRSELRAHPDAVERRPQRRVLPCQSPETLPAAHHRPRVPLRGDQRGDAPEQTGLAALVDEEDDLAPQAHQAARSGE